LIDAPWRGKLGRGANSANSHGGNINTAHLLVFTLDGERYALALEHVSRVVRAAALTPLPQAPEIVLGILDLQGEIIPVIDLRRRFRLPERPIGCEDQFVVARTGLLNVALVVDGTQGVLDLTDLELIRPEEIVAGTEYLSGVTRTAEGLVLIHDLDRLLFPDEALRISQALEEAQR
jgi:purine-binding chemotaxis protein CheW